jgi:transposase-like protein
MHTRKVPLAALHKTVADLRCPRCGSTKSWLLKDGRRRCARCRRDWRPERLPLRLSVREWREVLRWFVRDATGADTARQTGLSRKRVLRALTVVRRAIVRAEPGGERAANGPLDGVWADVQRQLKARGGIRRERMDLYLSSFVWRYNHRKLSAAEQVDALLRLLRQQR